MTHIKICGFTSPQSTEVAVDAGVDAVGLVFVPSARRRISVEQGVAIADTIRARRGDIEIVGMFADQPPDEVNEIAVRLRLDAVQLCGAENMGYCEQIRVPIYKVVAVDPRIPISAQMPKLMVLLQRHSLAGHNLVLDTRVDGEYGGTGQQYDWELAANIAEGYEFTLAGGLTPENVTEALATVRPWGVDTSSGVETDGEKDAAKVRAFVSAVRSADQSRHKRGLFGLFGGAGARG